MLAGAPQLFGCAARRIQLGQGSSIVERAAQARQHPPAESAVPSQWKGDGGGDGCTALHPSHSPLSLGVGVCTLLLCCRALLRVEQALCLQVAKHGVDGVLQV